jgi:hypothetical protein
MFHRCLHYSISPKGGSIKPDEGGPIVDPYYFAGAFLYNVGFFAQKFKIDKPLPKPTRDKIPQGLEG